MKSWQRGKLSVVQKGHSQQEGHGLALQGEITSKLGNGSTNQQKTTSQAATSPTEQSQEKVSNYGGWQPENARLLRGCHGLDNHLLQQAKSFLGRVDVTVEEARELWQRIDITTRKPK